MSEDAADTPAPVDASAAVNSEFLRVMQSRGYLYQCSNLAELDALMCKEIVPAYLGFDATASSLHVGSLLQIMILRHLQRCGHKPVVLVGGGTTKIGDPSGRDTTRQMLTDEQIDANIAGISKVFARFLTFGDGPTDAVLVNNDEWLGQLRLLPFLRDYGRYFTINRMLTFESVKQRLGREQPLTFLEFNYMIFQAYDFLELSRRYGCRLQMGGSDQWGNIISGVELGRRADDASLFAVTAPLITTADGKKMGKSLGGAVWLNEDLLPPYDYWQFWRNTDDADVVRFLRLFTELSDERIAELAQLEGAAINEAKVVLADEATRMLHGDGCLAAIRQTAAQLFTNGGGGGGVGSGGADMGTLPTVAVSRAELDGGITVVELFLKLNFAKSKSEVRRLIAAGGARLNDEKVIDEALVVGSGAFADGQLKVSSGKKKHGLVKLSQ
ncbi:hypothetical protein KFE25_010721 [Diacronema lutheri]|uniref:Tyrosine--tRNA ligase n=1 Tax=Diacronema lutheri TaxID=2081491 RepID=A0A8J6C8V9_DIALT|nr:hypothetical protein KFE25_010721 [Diacronema lutheri]